MRYARQELVLGKENQQKINNAKVAIIGVGALGTVCADLLARAGVGTLLLIDRDLVEESNLQRQTVFTEADINKSKAHVAKQTLQAINSTIKITSETLHLNNQNISVLDNYNLILDCTDNLQTKFLIDDYSRKKNKPWIYAAAIKTSGYVLPIIPNTISIRDFITETPGLDTCDTVGVLNTITTIIASLQTEFAIRIITEQTVEPTLHYVDTKNISIKKLTINKMKEHDFKYLEQPEQRVTRFCSAGRFQVLGKPINLEKVKQRLEKIDNVQHGSIALHFKNITLFKDGRALIKADSKEEALSIYSKYVGN